MGEISLRSGTVKLALFSSGAARNNRIREGRQCPIVRFAGVRRGGTNDGNNYARFAEVFSGFLIKGSSMETSGIDRDLSEISHRGGWW